MRKRRLGLLLLLAFVVSIAAIVQEFRFENSTITQRKATTAIEREISALEVGLSDFRAAEIGYLAAGQQPDFWIRRTSDLTSQMESGLRRLRSSSMAPETRSLLDSAAAALNDLGIADRRAREYVARDELSQASDVVFGEGLEATQRLASAIGSVREPEAAAATSHQVMLSRWRLGSAAVALIFVLAIAAYAISAPRPAVSAPPTIAEMLRELPPPVKTPQSVAPVRPAPLQPAFANLPEAAGLCADLARVIDGRDVPALLERAAKVLEAKGVIIWTIDSDAGVLRPALTYGYPERVLTRLGELDAEADNVTSLTFRSMRPQSMMAVTPGAPGAIAVPLVTASGCTGVLSAETRDGKPGTEIIALAQIIAAQFATMLPPAAASGAHAAEA